MSDYPTMRVVLFGGLHDGLCLTIPEELNQITMPILPVDRHSFVELPKGPLGIGTEVIVYYPTGQMNKEQNSWIFQVGP